jgi:hypothetical protein
MDRSARDEVDGSWALEREEVIRKRRQKSEAKSQEQEAGARKRNFGTKRLQTVRSVSLLTFTYLGHYGRSRGVPRPRTVGAEDSHRFNAISGSIFCEHQEWLLNPIYGTTRKILLLVSVPSEVVTVTKPVVAPLGILAVR